MKKAGGLFSVLAALVLLLYLIHAATNEQVTGFAVTGEAITGETITGEALAQNVGMNITVTAGAPTLEIINPKNGTYLTNESLLLNYSVSSSNNEWYHLNSGGNTSVSAPARFNVSGEGSHTLYLYANGTTSLTARNITFSVNFTIFSISYEEYKGTRKGASTAFYDYPYEEMLNMSNITLENTLYGKIYFKSNISLPDDANSADNSLNLDSSTNISFNRLEINSTAIPNFNVSSTIWLYNLTFTNPRILRDGAVCPSDICAEEDYTGGIFRFNATGISVFSAEETPVTPTPTPSVSGGGGGVRTVAAKREILLNKDSIKITLKQGETKKESITIRNSGNVRIRINISDVGMDKFVKPEEEIFEIEPGYSKTLYLDFLAREDAKPDLYLGKILVNADSIVKEVLVAIEIESKKPLFDVRAEIPRRFLYVYPGEEIMAKVQIYNLGSFGKVDVNLTYIIKSEDDEKILEEHETIAVETQASLIKAFQLPENIKLGDYVFYVRADYMGETASSSTWFYVVSKYKFIIISVIVALTLIILFIIFYLARRRRKKKRQAVNRASWFGKSSKLKLFIARLRRRMAERRSRKHRRNQKKSHASRMAIGIKSVFNLHKYRA